MSSRSDPVESVARISGVKTALEILRKATGLRVALVAHVTGDSWTACSIVDGAGLGLEAGQHLDVAKTY